MRCFHIKKYSLYSELENIQKQLFLTGYYILHVPSRAHILCVYKNLQYVIIYN
jgi:hypothetical protein